MKYYGDGKEIVYDKSYWVDYAKEIGKPIKVELQKRDIGGECLWCSGFGDFVYTKEDCGTICNSYKPRNRKNGCCRNASQGFIGTGEFYEINEKGRVSRINP